VQPTPHLDEGPFYRFTGLDVNELNVEVHTNSLLTLDKVAADILTKDVCRGISKAIRVPKRNWYKG
jgi:hypothetical protein